MKFFLFFLICLSLISNSVAEVEPAGSRKISGQEAKDLFYLMVGAGLKTEGLDNWREAKLIKVSVGKISCSYTAGDAPDGVVFPSCGHNMAPEKSYLLYQIAKNGSQSAYMAGVTLNVDKISCTGTFGEVESGGRSSHAYYECKISYPRSVVNL